ncbi:hypothetical protein AAFF_G00084020 [Aldrovandia affinis]|uniref:Aquaporin-4 n=1 Tax=Aldrovandia affinis TaxID=143900 RepID=A0AAD7WCB1_9TELE|nr:hypothetical protein AAFF_G00084020 [Aldrovandia affinis]
MSAYKVWSKFFWRAVTGEFLATLIFVLIGLSTTKWTATEEKPQASTVLLISLSFGLSISTMVYCFGHISGAHINPAVTVAMLFTRKISIVKAFFYLAAQCLGATAGSAILYVITPGTTGGPFGVTLLSSNISLLQGIAVELLITFQLVFTVFTTCDPKHSDLKVTAALAIGFSVFIGHLFAIPYTGASMNPARSLGPAVVTWIWENHWVYWVGPISGGLIAAILYTYLCHPNLELKQCVMGAFPMDHSVKQEGESFHNSTPVSPENSERSEWLESVLTVNTDKAEMNETSTIDAEKARPMELEHVHIDTEKEEKNDLSNCPQYEIKCKF